MSARSCEKGEQGSGPWGQAQVGLRPGLGLPARCEGVLLVHLRGQAGKQARCARNSVSTAETQEKADKP